MKLYIVDAFTTKRFSGNQAGVALLGDEVWPGAEFMQSLAAELKHSETAFVKANGEKSFRVRYFTPEGEVDLCGHATIATFTVLREEGIIGPGTYNASTLAGELAICISADAVWMDMAPPVEARTFTDEEAAELYAAYGLTLSDKPEGWQPKAVSTGLCDILLPVRSGEALAAAVQNEAEVTRLSQLYEVVGVHMFWPCLDGETACRCRNFAPLYAIPEEAATGTSNGALTYYLYQYGKVTPGAENRFVQGEKMGKPSEILSRLEVEGGAAKVLIGGHAVISLRAELVPAGRVGVTGLRPWRADDGPAFARYACDPAVSRFMNPGFPKTPEECDRVVAELAAADPTVQNCQAILVDGEVAGSVGLFLQGGGTASVAYWLGVPFRGNGIMARLLPDFCRAAFRRYPVTALTAKPHPDNGASRRTLERAGFRLSGDGETYILCLENIYDRFI